MQDVLNGAASEQFSGAAAFACIPIFIMAGFRAFYESDAAPQTGGEIFLSPEESRHSCGSLRAKTGDAVSVFDLDGMVWECRISKADQKRAALEAVAPVKVEKPKARVFVAQCLPKGKTFDDIIRQSIEVGASGIFPLMSEHSQVRLDERDALKKHEKWRTQVIEAVKQSANFSGYALAPVQTFKNFMAKPQDFDLKLVASLQDGAQPILKTLRERGENAKSVCVLVGPEGDLSEAEYAAAKDAGFLPCTLGGSVMKCETAALFSLSAICAYFGAK